MKKIFSILTLALLFAVVPASAQLDKGFNFGVKAGLNFTNMSNPSDAFKEGFMKTYTGFNAGMVLTSGFLWALKSVPSCSMYSQGSRPKVKSLVFLLLPGIIQVHSVCLSISSGESVSSMW